MLQTTFISLGIVFFTFPLLSQTPQEIVAELTHRYQAMENLYVEGSFQKNINGRIFGEGTYFSAMDKKENFIYKYEEPQKGIQYLFWKYDTDEKGTFQRHFGKQSGLTESLKIDVALSALTGGTSKMGIDLPQLFYGSKYNAFAMADSLILYPSEKVGQEDCFVLGTIKVVRKTEEERRQMKSYTDSVRLQKLGLAPKPNFYPSQTTNFLNKWWIRKKDYHIIKRVEIVIEDGETAALNMEWMTVEENASIDIKNYINAAIKN